MVMVMESLAYSEFSNFRDESSELEFEFGESKQLHFFTKMLHLTKVFMELVPILNFDSPFFSIYLFFKIKIFAFFILCMPEIFGRNDLPLGFPPSINI